MRILALLLMVGCSGGVRIDECAPDFGGAEGGDDVKIVGRGFGPGVTVSFGTKSAKIVSVTDAMIEVKTPSSYHSGPVDVVVVGADGKALMKKSCFRYQEPKSP